MKQTPCSARPYIQIYAELMKGNKTAVQLAELTGLAETSVRVHIRSMRASGLIKQVGTYQNGRGKGGIYGLGRDAKKTEYKPMFTCISFAAVLRAIDGHKTIKQIAEETGSGNGSTYRLMIVLKEYGLIYISKWDRDNSQTWQKVYSLGNKEDAPRPKKAARKVVNAKYWKAYANRKKHLEMIHATAGFKLAA